MARAKARRESEISLVIFDKDGTLIHFDEMWSGWMEQTVDAINDALRGRFPLGDVAVDSAKVKAAIFDAMGYDPVARKAVSKKPLACAPMPLLRQVTADAVAGACPGLDAAVIETAMVKGWDREVDWVALAHPRGDLRALFLWLRTELKVKIAVCTTDDYEPTIQTLKAFNVLELVEVVVCGDKPGPPLPPKPSPEQLQHICRKAGVDLNRDGVVMVGDTVTDMKMGQGANCVMNIGVLGGASTVEDLSEEADVIIPDLDHLPKLLSRISDNRETWL